MSKEQLKATIDRAKKKGLTVRRNQFKSGWSVLLPNGSGFHALDDKDMVHYVKAY